MTTYQELLDIFREKLEAKPEEIQFDSPQAGFSSRIFLP